MIFSEVFSTSAFQSINTGTPCLIIGHLMNIQFYDRPPKCYLGPVIKVITVMLTYICPWSCDCTLDACQPTNLQPVAGSHGHMTAIRNFFSWFPEKSDHVGEWIHLIITWVCLMST